MSCTAVTTFSCKADILQAVMYGIAKYLVLRYTPWETIAKSVIRAVWWLGTGWWGIVKKVMDVHVVEEEMRRLYSTALLYPVVKCSPD